MEASLCTGWIKGEGLGLARESYHNTVMPDVDGQILVIFKIIMVRVYLPAFYRQIIATFFNFSNRFTHDCARAL